MKIDHDTLFSRKVSNRYYKSIITNLRNIRNSGYHYNYCDNEDVIIIF